MDKGLDPWWAQEMVRLAFFRPLASLTYWIDYQLWPMNPTWMHLQSILWLGAVVFLASVLYRRVIASAWVVGCASLLYALDDSFLMPAFWLANRYVLVSLFFGLLCLIAYDKWRRDGWWMGAPLALIAFAMALFGSEAGVGTAAYLFAYAVFLDRRVWWRRLGALTPFVLVGLGWLIVHENLGYGATGSSSYIDPRVSPVGFLKAAAERGPVLFWGQWAFPSAEAYNTISPAAANVFWIVSLAFMIFMAGIFAYMVKRDALA